MKDSGNAHPMTAGNRKKALRKLAFVTVNRLFTQRIEALLKTMGTQTKSGSVFGQEVGCQYRSIRGGKNDWPFAAQALSLIHIFSEQRAANSLTMAPAGKSNPSFTPTRSTA